MSDAPSQPASAAPQNYPVAESVLRQKQELGLLGKIFGGREHAPINIAGAIIIVGLIALVASPFLPESNSLTHGDLAKALGGLILAAFTFLGGYLGGGSKQS